MSGQSSCVHFPPFHSSHPSFSSTVTVLSTAPILIFYSHLCLLSPLFLSSYLSPRQCLLPSPFLSALSSLFSLLSSLQLNTSTIQFIFSHVPTHSIRIDHSPHHFSLPIFFSTLLALSPFLYLSDKGTTCSSLGLSSPPFPLPLPLFPSPSLHYSLLSSVIFRAVALSVFSVQIPC